VCPLIFVKDFCAVMSALQAIYILTSAGTFFQFAWWFSYSSEGSMLVNLFCRQPISLTVIDFSESDPTCSQSSHGKGRFWYF
jgi:glycerol-3-phosphate acyltransferase PlsY